MFKSIATGVSADLDRIRKQSVSSLRRANSDPDEIHDAVTEALMMLVTKTSQHEQIRSPDGYVAFYARRRLIDQRRAHPRPSREVLMEFARTRNIANTEPSDRAIQRERKELVRESISHLPRKIGEAMQVYFIEEKSAEEAFSILKISKATLFRHLINGKKLLRNKLNPRN